MAETIEFRENPEEHLREGSHVSPETSLRREQIARKLDAGVSALEVMTPEQTAEHIAWMRERGHAEKRHVGKTDAQLDHRALQEHELHLETLKTAEDPEKVPPLPIDYTSFRSPEALAAAEVTAWEASKAERLAAEERYRSGRSTFKKIRVECEVPLKDALGPSWPEHVNGRRRTPAGGRPTPFTGESVVRVAYLMDSEGNWYPKTIYPKVEAAQKFKPAAGNH